MVPKGRLVGQGDLGSPREGWMEGCSVPESCLGLQSGLCFFLGWGGAEPSTLEPWQFLAEIPQNLPCS